MQRPKPLTLLAVCALLVAGCAAPESRDGDSEHAGHEGHGDHAAHQGEEAGHEDASGDHADHGAHGGTGHAGATGTGPTGEGPVPTAQEILDGCAGESAFIRCVTDRLLEALTAHGSVVAFDLLAEAAILNTEVDRQSHPMAHDLGRHALHVYGTIRRALETCSYKVFQGCFHGALQEHFERLSELRPDAARGLCPENGTRFEIYTCQHGVGHGLVLATHYDLARSLEMCDALDGFFAEQSCYGGAFMENLVAYINSETGGHAHGHAPDGYWVDRSDPAYPCNAVGSKYRSSCWLLQTSLVLFLNGGDFAAAADVCAGLEATHVQTCFTSLGRDASAYSARDPGNVAAKCALASEDAWRAACIKGFIAEVVLNYADPAVALDVCAQLGAQDKPPCYHGMGVEGKNMVSGERMADLCARVEAGYEDDCRRGAQLPARG